MKNLRITTKSLLLMASLLTTYSVQSAVGDIVLWPFVTEISSVPNGSSQKTVSLTLDMIPVRQTDTRPTLGQSVVLITSGVNQVGYITGPDLLGSSINLTYQQASSAWLAKYGMHTVIVRNLGLNYAGGCAAVSIYAANMNSSTNIWDGVTYGPIGPSVCTKIPISDYRCNITPASLNIDYGRVNATEANGKIASINFNMACDGPVTFSFSSSVGEKLALDTKLSAQLSIDGKPLGTKLTIPAGSTAHTLSAQLSATNVAAGTYSQSTALIINYQ